MNRAWPLAFGAPMPLVGWLMIGAGAGIAGTALLTFLRERTAILPHRPATKIVAIGPYRYTRNPMYIGLSLAYCGISLLANQVWPLLLLPGVLATLWVAVIRREELYLAEAFGAEYEEYRRQVRRWI